mmetsp:Transcript_1811/g.5264  ORF Transcript_1811/g.5264 Transcript_1811/m.5264 type:complete len:161 (-) Transcript_1811:1453-1935(-)
MLSRNCPLVRQPVVISSSSRLLPCQRQRKSTAQAAATTQGQQAPLPPPPLKRPAKLQQQRERLSRLRRDAEIAAVAALTAAALSFDFSPAAFADPPGLEGQGMTSPPEQTFKKTTGRPKRESALKTLSPPECTSDTHLGKASEAATHEMRGLCAGAGSHV